MNTLKTQGEAKSGIQATLESVKKMSDEELRLVVAELAGTSKPNPIYEHRYGPGPMKIIGYKSPKSPDYPHDLNAVHSVIQSLGVINRSHFQRQLNLVADKRHVELCELSARDWCECLLTSKREE